MNNVPFLKKINKIHAKEKTAGQWRGGLRCVAYCFFVSGMKFGTKPCPFGSVISRKRSSSSLSPFPETMNTDSALWSFIVIFVYISPR